ncbi:Polyprenol reductase [Erysiphe neolycopersici]|uniref:Polyprenal reductase n=1 Tax=Erysiphe neolycopersici TaxID=212602 RepID=A0A420HT38_9PEZI|nr:Polyprenol reductase [Erysiphe neolycopersici]
MDPSLLCRNFFIIGSAACLGGVFFTSFRRKVMDYGSRSINETNRVKQKQKFSTTTNLLSQAASFRVPHSWFTHYYIASVLSSYFWLYQIITYGTVVRFLKSLSTTQSLNISSMSINQVFLTWLLMAIQGSRRLMESLTLMKSSSQSQMWAGIWIIGIIFYIIMGIAVWIEGISQLDHQILYEEFPSLFSGFTLKSFIALGIFLLASTLQNICHRHLFHLQKYSLPNHLLFRWITCPHYTCECLIYLSLALISAPQGKVFNSTVLTGLIFVLSNLAITADGTLKWYEMKFGTEKIITKWRMIPLLY